MTVCSEHPQNQRRPPRPQLQGWWRTPTSPGRPPPSHPRRPGGLTSTGGISWVIPLFFPSANVINSFTQQIFIEHLPCNRHPSSFWEFNNQQNRWKKSQPVKDCYLVAQSRPTLCDPIDCSLPGSSVHGISRIPEWVAISSSRGSS